MKFYRTIFQAVALLLFFACTENNKDVFIPDQPTGPVDTTYPAQYDALKTYVDRSAYPNFLLGAGAGLPDYVNKTEMYNLLNKNFDEIVLGWEMKHGAVVSNNGDLNSSSITNIYNLIKTAKAAGIKLYGHTLCWHANQNATYLNSLVADESMTADEKYDAVDKALEKFIKGMMSTCTDYVYAWDVVNEPMDDWPDQTKLKTGIGRTEIAADEFFWQDYLGEYYAARAIELARKYWEQFSGNPDDLKLFINDYGLENSNQKKCNGLIAYIGKIEKDKGVKVDGIGTQMHVTCNETTIAGIKAMYRNLAATGKIIKVSELDMGYKDISLGRNLKTEEMTAEQHYEMAEFYEEIVKAYFEIIPVE